MPSKRKLLEGKTSSLATLEDRLKNKAADSKSDEYPDGFFMYVKLISIKPDPNQPRKVFEPKALKELSDSIKAKGVLQPVLVRKDGEGFWLVAGERRYRAAKMAGLEEIPAIFTTGNPSEIALIENLQRENLNPFEEAQAYARMIDEFNYTHEMLAAAIGKARNTITQSLSLNKLPEEIKVACPRADIPKRTLVEIAKMDSPEKMVALYNRVKDFNLTTDDVRAITTRKKQEKKEISPAVLLEKKVAGLIHAVQSADISNEEKGLVVSLFEKVQELQKALRDLIKTV